MLRSIITLFLVIQIIHSAKILGVFQMPSYSHQVVFQQIWKELSLRGHDVTVVTPFALNDKSLTNLTEIEIPKLIEIAKRRSLVNIFSIDVDVMTKIKSCYELNYELAATVFEEPRFKKIIQDPNSKFDIVLMQIYISPIFSSLGYRFNAPVIGINSMGAYIGTHFAMGNPNHPALYSEMYLPYHGDLTFMERWYMTYYNIWTRLFLYFDAMPKCDKIVKKYLGNDAPYIADLESNMSAIMITTNPILYEPRPVVPTIIPISQVHLVPPKPLPKDIKEILDNAKNGVIYLSLGSNVQSKANMPDRFRETLIKIFSELPYTVIWKWEDDFMPKRPKNVFIKKWIPQNDVLAHPNIIAFVTQCGLQSLEEAFKNSVPMVCIPFISDQEMNTRRLAKLDVVIQLDRLTSTEEEIKRAILDVIQNKKYKENIIELQKLLTDEPLTGVDKPVWWIEHTLRHKGLRHLRSPTIDMPWWKFLLLDVISATLLVILLPIIAIRKILSRVICCSTNKANKKGKKTN